MGEMQSVSDMIVGSLTVDDFSGLLSKSNMLPLLLIFAILFGFAFPPAAVMKALVGKLLANLNDIIMKSLVLL